MIRRVHVKGYKSFKDIELTFSRLNVVFGPNAAGKSNLFDVLGLISRLATSQTLRDAFSDPHRGTPYEAFSYGPGGLDDLLAAAQVSMTLEVDVEIDSSVVEHVETQIRQLQAGLGLDASRHHVVERLLRYRVEIELSPGTGILRVKDEYLAALRADGKVRGDRSPFIGRADGRLRLRGEGAGRPSEPGELLPYTLVANERYAPHHPHVAAFREELSRWRFYYLEPDGMRTSAPIQDVPVLNHDGSLLTPFFFTLKQRAPEELAATESTLQSLIPLVTSLRVDQEQGLAQLWVKEAGVWYSTRQISEGTLRVLGLLAIMSPLQPVAVVGFEEPENGVHPRRLALIARLLASQVDSPVQYLINTHSPFFMKALLGEMKGSGRLGWVSCWQDTSGSSHFESVPPASLDEELFVTDILEGAYGG